jgi:hypothetical protein
MIIARTVNQNKTLEANMTERKATTATPFNRTILTDLPCKDSWRVWGKKINGRWSPESLALVTPFTPPDTDFQLVAKCKTIEQWKDNYRRSGQSFQQLAIDFMTNLNATENT